MSQKESRRESRMEKEKEKTRSKSAKPRSMVLVHEQPQLFGASLAEVSWPGLALRTSTSSQLLGINSATTAHAEFHERTGSGRDFAGSQGEWRLVTSSFGLVRRGRCLGRSCWIFGGPVQRLATRNRGCFEACVVIFNNHGAQWSLRVAPMPEQERGEELLQADGRPR